MASVDDAMADSDDDIVIMDEKTAEQSIAAKLPSLEAIAQMVNEQTANIEMTEMELKLIQKEINRPEAELSKEVQSMVEEILTNPSLKISANMTEQQLDEMITQVLESIPESMWDIDTETYLDLSSKLESLERESQNVSKMFLNCHSQLKEYRKSKLAELEEVNKKISTLMSSESNRLPACISTPDFVREPNLPSSSGDARKTHVSPAKAQQPKSSDASTSTLPPLSTLRSQLASTITRSMPTLVSSLQQQQTNIKPVGASVPSAGAMPQPIQWPELNVGDKILGKKFNDIWYSGTVTNISSADSVLEWRCRVKFDGKGNKWLPGKHIAYRDPINCFIRHGTRVVALYREDGSPNTFYAGVIAEAPSFKNNRRFLVFFDDGYAQYCDARELHKVYKQSLNVWDDINLPETSAFIKEYLRIYPERPMVRLSKGQVVKTEWNGQWWTSKVLETDASLVKMYFQSDKRTEWIYRGSTRLEPLYKALANADAIKAAGSAKGRRHNLSAKPFASAQQKPSVEYTRGAGFEESNQSSSSTLSQSTTNSTNSVSGKDTPKTTTIDSKKKTNNVAKKSTTPVATNSSNIHSGRTVGQNAADKTKKIISPSSSAAAAAATSLRGGTDKSANKGKCSRDIASVLHARLVQDKVEYSGHHATGERRELKVETKPRVPFKPHTCCKDCLQGVIDDPALHRGKNVHLIPLLFGWERQIGKSRAGGKRIVRYRAPCGRHLRNLDEADQYLYLTNSQLPIDLFCFDHRLCVDTEFVPIKTFCDIKDLSYGRENYPVSCVNGVDRHYPDYVEYSDHRIPSKKVNLNLDEDFLVCCDCTDNCRDRSKCACQQLTIEHTSWIGEKDMNAGYHHRRLKEPLFTGIVECNARCKCDKRCSNRVAQNGLNMRLQVFKTEEKGWGLRCLDDIAKGSFICIYAGQLLTDREANEDGKQYGDQYLAELDFIEVVERQKEGYESDVEDMDFSEDEKDANYNPSQESKDSDFAFSGRVPTDLEKRSLRQRKSKDAGKTDDSKVGETKKKAEDARKERLTISDDDDSKDGRKGEKKDKDENGAKIPRAKKSTGGSRLNPSIPVKPSQESTEETGKEQKKERIPTRDFFQDDTECYIMDAKMMGNLGRYLNHSCDPNVFVQNIFVDTHDLRFPWVTFWAGRYIRAGTELTWDYNYEVGSVPDRVLYCYCLSSTCRGRLL